MIQDIGPHCFNNHYTEQQPDENGVFFYIKGGKLLLKQTKEGIVYPRKRLMDGLNGYVYLFSLDDEKYFLCKEKLTEEMEAGILKEGFSYEPAGSFRSLAPRHLAFAGITAMHLKNWYEKNRFCGRCGQQMEMDHKERMMHCPACNNMVYPRISPAVIVAVTKGDEILLTKYAGRTYARYALIAGYTEIGETAEETVCREVMEEAGVKVKNIRYYKSQPWAFSETLLLGFYCEVDGDTTIHMDKEELSVACWVKREDISKVQESYDDISLTNEMICRFRDGLV